jgi:spore germination cell wall hydrolase CwlJ-like protein
MKKFLAVMTAMVIASGAQADADTGTPFYKQGVEDLNEQVKYDPNTYPQIECMALNIYYEARSSSNADQYAVADVVLNRVQDTRYPNTICDVVKQGMQDSNGNMRRNKCQFSWYCDGKADTPHEMDAFYKARSIAWDVIIMDTYRGITEGATHYHTTYVNPAWSRSKRGWSITRVGQIGTHIFYRWN